MLIWSKHMDIQSVWISPLATVMWLYTITLCWESAAMNGCCVIEVRQDPKVHPEMFRLSLPDLLSTAPLRPEDSRHLLPYKEVGTWKSEMPLILKGWWTEASQET